MAAYSLIFTLPSNYHNPLRSTKKSSSSIKVSKLVQCVSDAKSKNSDFISRRSADYKPCIWDTQFLQSLHNDYAGETHERRAEKLQTDVKIMMKNIVKHLDQLELIHVLQRLGLAYHFKDEISRILENIWNCSKSKSNWDEKDLYETALGFRLLRQHGYCIPQDVFERFLDNNGRFNECIGVDVKGILSLYEASYYSIDNESIMEEAWDFSYKHLKEVMNSPTILQKANVDIELVSHALDIPLHWRITRLEARWYVDVYERESGMNPVILELAKLDFNIVQAIHQQELTQISRRWKMLGLGKRLSFARDRLVEAYLWAIGTTFVPQDEYCRKVITNAVAIATVIDDIYDVYGTLDELILFTKAVERWDIKSIEELPYYMKICFVAFYNIVNEMAYEILREQNQDVLPHLRKWLGLLKTYLKEAKWYHTGYKPTLEEYMNNGWISVAGPLMNVLAYISATKEIKKEALEFLENGPEIVRFANMIFRLCDDFGTSTDELTRGDVPKAIQCNMYGSGVSEEVSRKQMRELIRQTWKKTNEYRFTESPLPKTIVEMILNITRTSHIMYQYGDGHGIQEGVTTDIELALLVEPIPL